jgi:transcriptional regulator with XRE-family HTH domain
VWSAVLIREARLRAGLTQQELANRSGRKRSVIARWEQGAIEPSLETFLEIIAVCGFDLPIELTPRDDSLDKRLRKNAVLSPERRAQRALKASPAHSPFDPYTILSALERARANYVLIGAFARIVQGADETTVGIDIVPSVRGNNLRRVALALGELDAQPTATESALGTPSAEFRTSAGPITIETEPAGTRGGYDDLRRAAGREAIGKGLRVMVASIGDLARMLAAGGSETELPKLIALRRLQRFEHERGREMSR